MAAATPAALRLRSHTAAFSFRRGIGGAGHLGRPRLQCTSQLGRGSRVCWRAQVAGQVRESAVERPRCWTKGSKSRSL